MTAKPSPPPAAAAAKWLDVLLRADVESVDDLPSDLCICAKEEDGILLRCFRKKVVDSDQGGRRISHEHLVALRKPNVRKLCGKRLLGCADLGTFVALNPPRQANSATGIDTFVLEPGFPDELRGVGFEGRRV